MAAKARITGSNKNYGLQATVHKDRKQQPVVTFDKVDLLANPERRAILTTVGVAKARRFAQWILDNTEE